MRIIKPNGLVYLGNNEFKWSGADCLEVKPVSATLSMRLLRQDANTMWSLSVVVPYDLETYPTLNSILKHESIFVVNMGDNVSLPYDQYQFFRVYDIDRTTTQVTCSCAPIFTDCEQLVIKDTRPTDATAKDALTKLFDGTDYIIDAEYNGSEETEPTKTAIWEWTNALTLLNGDNENSFIQKWGGEFFFNNYEIKWRYKIDRFKDMDEKDLIRIKAGLNMESIEHKIDDTDLVTEIWPVAYNGYHYKTKLDDKSNYEYSSIKSPNYSKFAKGYPSIIKYEDIKLTEDASTDEIAGKYSYLYGTVTEVPSRTQIKMSSLGYVQAMTIIETNYQFTQDEINTITTKGHSRDWTVSSTSDYTVDQIVIFKVTNSSVNSNSSTGAYNYVVAKITKIATDATVLTCESIGLDDTGYTDSTYAVMNTAYKYTQEKIEEVSAKGYSQEWTVSSSSAVSNGDPVLIKLTNSTSNATVYILAHITNIADATHITATSEKLSNSTDISNSSSCLITGYSFSQTLLEQYGAVGYTHTWDVDETFNTKAGTIAFLRVEDTSKTNTVIVCDKLEDVYNALKEKAEAEYSEDHVDEPNITYNVSFIDLTGTVKYEGFEQLVHLQLGDTVMVYNEELDISKTARITEITYDAVNNLVTSMTLGDYAKDYIEEQVSQSRTVSTVVNSSKTGVNGETIVGVQDGTSTQIQVTKDETSTGDIRVIKFEDTDSTSDHYGAIAFGTQGLMATTERATSGSGWNWTDDSIMMNEKQTFYGKFGNQNGSKWVHLTDAGMEAYDGGVSGTGYTGSITGDQFTTINGVVVGSSQWQPVTYSLQIGTTKLILVGSDGSQSAVALPTKEIVKSGYDGNGIKEAKLNDDYTLTLNFTDGTSYTTASIRGEKGAKGEQGVQGIQGVKGDTGDPCTITYQDISYQESESPTVVPVGQWQSELIDVLQGNYLWCRVKQTFSDGTDSLYYTVSRFGVDGAGGGKGETGATGVGVSEIKHYYLATGLDTGVTRDNNGWTELIQKVDETKKYLWRYDETIWTNDSKTYTEPYIYTFYNKGDKGDQGEKGDKGDQGVAGEPGADGKTSYTHFAYANSSDGQIGFSTSVSNGKSYIGIYVDSTESDSTDPTKYNWSQIKGDKGTGFDGDPIEHFAVNNDSTTAPTRWSNSRQQPDGENKYLWYYETIKFTDGTSWDSTPRIIATFADGFTDITAYYCLSTSGTEFTHVDGYDWMTTMPSIQNGMYLWQKYIILKNDNTTEETTPVVLNAFTDLGQSVNSAKQEIDDLNATVTTQANNITEINNNFSNYYTKTETNTQITQTANSINQTVSSVSQVANSANSKIDNLEIGGRNLLLNSSLHENYDDWETVIRDGYTCEFVTKENYQCLHINSSVLTQTTYFSQPMLKKLSANTEYTMSGWYWTENIVKGTTNHTIMNCYADGNYKKDGTAHWFGVKSSNMNINTGGWIYFTNTFTTPTSDIWDNAIWFTIMVYARDFTGDIYIRDLKLEKGNKATDWTPAPEDTQSDIDDVTNTLTNTRGDVSSLQSTTTQLSSQVETALTGISTNVTAINQVQTNLNDFKKTTQSDIKQSADSLKIELSNSIENTNKSLDNVNTTVSEMKSYMNFTTDSNSKPVLELGTSDSSFKTRLSNSELAFMQGETKVAYISESKLNITEADINTSLKIGNFAFVPRSNGSLDFKKVGGI